MMELLQLLSFDDAGWGDELLAGLLVTVQLALATLPFGLALGFLIALAGRSGYAPLRWSAAIYSTVFRGLPELLTLFIIYYGGQILLQSVIGLFADVYVEVSGFLAGMIALGFVFSAFAAEVFGAALSGVPKGQGEAAEALGLSRFKALRLIVLPQVVRLALPGLGNLWLVLLKETALVSIIAMDDLLRKTNIAVGISKQPIFFYLVAAGIYLTLALISSRGLYGVEKYVNRGQERSA